MKKVKHIIGGVEYEALLPTEEEIAQMEEHEFFTMCQKVNIPYSPESYQSGNGEGVWVLGSPHFNSDYREDVKEGIHLVQLYNDSIFYPALTHKTYLLVEMRGIKRPVVVYSQLQDLECLD